jgi:hypothetical protein
MAGRCHVAHVLVDGRWLWTTQGTADGAPELASKETSQMTGRSLAQINSRLFELTGTMYLAQVLHLQVSCFFQENASGEDKILCHRGEGQYLRIVLP